MLAVTSCKSTEVLHKSTGSSLFNGVFTLLNTSYNGRPVYRHERRTSLHLYYAEPVDCSDVGAWVVADGLGSTASTSMFTVDDAVDPRLISSHTAWFVYDRTTDQFSPDTQISLACYAVSSPATA